MALPDSIEPANALFQQVRIQWQIKQDQTSEILTFVDADGKVPVGE